MGECMQMLGGRGGFQAEAEAGGDCQVEDIQFEGNGGEGGTKVFQLSGKNEACQVREPNIHELPKDKDFEHYEIRKLEGGDLPEGLAADISRSTSCFKIQHGGQSGHVCILFS